MGKFQTTFTKILIFLQLIYSLNQHTSSGPQLTFLGSVNRQNNGDYYCYDLLIRPYQMQIDPSLSKLIQTVVILPKFVFVNHSKYDIVLAQPGVNHLQKVRMNCRVPVIWRQDINRMLSFCPLMPDLNVQ